MGQILFCILFGMCALTRSIACANAEGISQIICSKNKKQASSEIIDCSIHPLLTISTTCEGMTDVTEEVGRGHRAVHFRHATNVTMTCSGKNPIAIDILRPTHRGIDDAIYHRSTGNFSDMSTYCYKLEIRFELVASTGDYICKEIFGPNRVSSIYIMSDGGTPGGTLLDVDTYGNSDDVTADDSGWIEFPCIVTNLNTTPQLHFYENNEDKRVPNEQYKYMPGVGFRMKANIVQSWGVASCKLDFLSKFFHVRNRKILNGTVVYYRVFPNMANLKRTQGMLKCESNYPISFHTDFVLKSIETTFSEASESFYKYRIIWKGNVSTAPVEKHVIQCRLKLTNMSIHEWAFDGNAIDSRQGVAYVDNSTRPRIVCSSRNQFPTIAFFECNNPINCLLARNFSGTDRANWHHQIRAREGFRCPVGIGFKFKCAVVPYDEVTTNGIVRCAFELGTRETYDSIFISGFTKKLVNYAYLDNPTSLNTGDILRLNFSKLNQAISVNENVYFECKASSFIFATGVHLRFMLADNSFIGRENPLVGRYWYSIEKEQDGVIVLNVSVTIRSPDISKVYCFAPYWNTPDWANVSKSLHVAHPEPVGSSAIIYNKGDENKSIDCGEWGSSTMSTIWFKDGKELQREDYFRFGDKRRYLLFPYVIEHNAGIYLCTRGNSTGVWSKTIEVVVESAGGNYTLEIVLGACAVFMISGIIWISSCLFRRQHVLSKEEIRDFKQGKPITNMNGAEETLSEAGNTPYKEESVEVPFNEFSISMDEVLGDGAFGVVYTAQVRGVKVAAKTVRNFTGKQELLALLSELKLLSCITCHENVVGLIGAYTAKLHKGKLFVFLEFCHRGSLYSILRKYRQECSAGVSRALEIKTRMLMDWSQQISVGMEYLALNKIIHGDLATRNVLLTENLVAKISDFGLSRKLYHYVQYHKSSQEPLPWRWLAIEALEALVFSEKSDVWSYGVTLWEIYSLANVPYPGLDWSADFVTKLKTEGVRLSKPEFADEQMYNLMNDCWLTRPNERPTFQSLKCQLSELKTTQKELGIREVIPLSYKSDPSDYTPLLV